jgi:hypothetical protein
MATPDRPSTSSAERLTGAVFEPLRPFIRIDSADLPSGILEAVAESVAEASRRLAAVLRPDRTCNVVVGKRPFHLNLANGQLDFTPLDEVVQAHVNNIVFVDAERLVTYPPVFRVAMMLEEFVHVFMAVDDETFVMSVVAALYPEIAVVGGQYAAASL